MNAPIPPTTRGALLVGTLLALLCSCGKSPTTPITAAPFGSDSLGTWIAATEPANSVVWSGATGRLYCAHVTASGHDVSHSWEHVQVVHVDPTSGGLGTVIVEGESEHPVCGLSPSGRYLLFDESAVEIANPSHRVGVWFPGWFTSIPAVLAPNDSLLATYGRAALYDNTDPEDTVLVHDWNSSSPGRPVGRGHPQIFSPDSRQLMVFRYADRTNYTTWIVDVDTGDSVSVPESPGGETWLKLRVWDQAGPTEYYWDPLADQLHEWRPRSMGNTIIHSVPNEDLGRIVRSADASHLAFTTELYLGLYSDSTRTTVWSCDRITGAVTQLLQGLFRVEDLALAPDGRRLALICRRRVYLRDVP